MANLALIMAAGRGSRFESDIPKQYHQINSQYILNLTINKFLRNNYINFVKVVINLCDLNLYRKIANNIDSPKLLEPAYGCAIRQDSVYNGLITAKNLNINKILIHDGVRPFISDKLINKVIFSIETDTGVMIAKKITNTIRKIQNDISKTICRENLFSVETPQGFIFNEILQAHQQFRGNNFTDDIALFEKQNKKIKVIESDNKNIKITYRGDIYA